MVDFLAGRRIALVSRIFVPEPGAASLRLRALARRMHARGAEVTVHTSAPPPGAPADPLDEPYRITRFPVLRDKAGYVRGYLQYLSFDVPAFFRLLFARRSEALIIEPPPTTGAILRVAALLRRTPYYFYAADIWSEAASVAGAPKLVVRVVRAFERFVYAGAAAVFAVSESVARRVAEVHPAVPVHVVGNGFEPEIFRPDGTAHDMGRPYLLYAGTASEVHGARIFVDALPEVLASVPNAKVVFIGQGAEREEIAAAADAAAPGAVEMLPRLSAEETAQWIRGARATLASMLPGGYEAFPTKMYASAGCGVPVVYAGGGMGSRFAREPDVGWAVDYEPAAVTSAMIEALQRSDDGAARARLAEWADRHCSLNTVADRIVDIVSADLARKSTTRKRGE